MLSLANRIEILRTGPHDPACMEIIDDLVRRLEIARAGTVAVVSEAVLTKALPLSRMDRMLDAGWNAVVQSDIYD